jgi:hypothetical protein
MNKMNSTTKIIAGVAVLALLFAAVGYATYTGTAKTYNEGNGSTVNYVSIFTDDWAPFASTTGDEANDFDSYTYKDATTEETVTVYSYSGTVTTTDITIGEDTAAVTYKAKALTSAANGYTITDGRVLAEGEDSKGLKLSIKAFGPKSETGVRTPAIIGSTDFVYFIEIKYGGYCICNYLMFSL